MTRDEAIKTLYELWRETNDAWYEEVYKMAIEALQWQDRILTQIENIVPKEHGERREE